jgi:toxin FitB
VVAATVDRGRHPRRRLADLLIAATAHAHHLELYTRNAADFDGLGELMRVVGV